jgi:hypothetical protein
MEYISREDILVNMNRGCLIYYTLKNFIEHLNYSNIKYTHIKGEALSLQTYNNYGCRRYNDFDIFSRSKTYKRHTKCTHGNAVDRYKRIFVKNGKVVFINCISLNKYIFQTFQ